MTSKEIKLAANMFSIVAEMEEIKANIEAMKAENEIRKSSGDALAYPASAFVDEANSLSHISWRLRNEVDF